MHGHFVWFELMTTDMAAAERFYGTVTGWTAQDSGLPGMRYDMFRAPGAANAMVAGIMTIPEHAAGAPPSWSAYAAVDDVDAAAETSVSLGAAIHRGPADIPGVGRFVLISDPQGAMIALFKSSGSSPGAPPPRNAPGVPSWCELHTSNPDAAFDFYSALLGWTRADAIDMGPMGSYQMFDIEGVTVGGMMKAQHGHTHWLYYVNVDAIEPAAERVRAAGGTVINGPHQVPGESWIIQGTDPQGAAFALVQPAA